MLLENLSKETFYDIVQSLLSNDDKPSHDVIYYYDYLYFNSDVFLRCNCKILLQIQAYILGIFTKAMAGWSEIVHLLRHIKRKAAESFTDINHKILSLEEKYCALSEQNECLKNEIEKHKQKVRDEKANMLERSVFSASKREPSSRHSRRKTRSMAKTGSRSLQETSRRTRAINKKKAGRRAAKKRSVGYKKGRRC